MTAFEQKYFIDRRGTGSMKWDALQFLFGRDDLLPMWVADMDFRSPECVGEALKRMGDSGLFGYFMPDRGYSAAFLNWEEKRHGYTAKAEWMRVSPGVVAGIFHGIGAFTEPGDACIILSPCYYPFMEAVQNCGRKLVCSHLINTHGIYTINFEDFEQKIRENDVKLFVLCSPHNPVGRIWKKDELSALMDICRRNGVLVISDEIHQDIEVFGHKHIPTLASCDCGDFTMTLTAASKTFNMAAFSHAITLIPNPDLRKKFDAYMKHIHLNAPLPGYVAVQAAYEGGAPWLDAVLKRIEDNSRLVTEMLTAEAPEVVISPLEGTYLQWYDLAPLVKPEDVKEFMVERCGIAVDYGHQFFTPEAGKSDSHIRLNLATTEELARSAAERLVRELKH